MDMLKTPRFWLVMTVIFLALAIIGNRAHAQTPATTGTLVTYDALRRTGQSDVVPAPAPAAKRPATPRPRVDTVRIVTTDTVRLLLAPEVPATSLAFASHIPAAVALVPSHHAPVTAPAPRAAASAPAPKSNAPTFAPSLVSGLLQVQLTGGDSLLRATYRIRRAELKLVTDLGRRAQAIVMIDGAKALSLNTSGTQPTVTQSTRVLQDAYITAPVRRVQIDAGQQRLPLGYEGGMGSSSLETIDRALFESDRARGGALGDVRDLGVAIRGTYRWLEYRAGAFNGSGESMNETDRNVAKAAVGQLALKPAFVRGLRLGASGATSGPATGDKPARDRVGADLVLTRTRAAVQAEFMTGRDGALQRQGGYVLASVVPRAGIKLVTRFDAFDPDIHREATGADVTQRDWLGGITWIPTATRLKLHAAVVHRTYTRGITPSVTQLLTQLQAAW
jgi:hypothetical protein